MDIKVVSKCLEQFNRALAANGSHNELRSLIKALQSSAEVFRRDVQQTDCLPAVVPWYAKSEPHGTGVSAAKMSYEPDSGTHEPCQET